MSFTQKIKQSYQLTELDKAIVKNANDNLTLPFFNRMQSDLLTYFVLPCLDLKKDLKTVDTLRKTNKKSGHLFHSHLQAVRLKQLLQCVIYGKKMKQNKYSN